MVLWKYKQLIQLFSKFRSHSCIPFCMRSSLGLYSIIQERTMVYNCRTFSLMSSTFLSCDEDSIKGNENDIHRNDKQKQEELIKNEVQNNRTYNADDVKNIKNLIIPVGSFLTEVNFDSIFLNICAIELSYDAGKSYFRSIYSPGVCNIATIGKYFRFCYCCRDKCTDDDKMFIWELYNEVLRQYSIFDGTTCENAALALSITDKWKESLKLLEMSKESTVIPSSKMYSEIIIAAFSNDEIKLGWDLMNEMVQNLRKPNFDVYDSWLKVCFYSKEAFTRLFDFFEDYRLQLTEDDAQRLVELYNKISRKAFMCFINKSGKCSNCLSYLNSIKLTDEEFYKLRNIFLDPVLIGQDIFIKTKPSEFESYLKFLKSVGKVDIVLDGLNVAYSGMKNSINMSFVLQSVVKHFVNQNKKVLVFGRQHLGRLKAFDYIRKNASYFLTEDVTYDDPFLLYAAMQSGYGTYFLSRDQMRGHKFLLKDPELRMIFSKWQQKYQCHLQHVTPQGRVILRDQLPYELKAHQNGSGHWHIPVTTDTTNIPGHLKAGKLKWLCLLW